MLLFRLADHIQRFAALASRASTGRRNEFHLYLIINRSIDIAGADIGVEDRLIMGERVGAGSAIRQFWPVWPRGRLGRRRRDRRLAARAEIAARLQNPGKKGESGKTGSLHPDPNGNQSHDKLREGQQKETPKGTRLQNCRKNHE